MEGKMFDERIAFNLPRKWEFIEETDKDGDKSFKLCYNISRNSDGEKQTDKSHLEADSWKNCKGD